MNAAYQISAAGNDHKPWIRDLSEALFRPDIEAIWGWDEAWQRENFAAEWATCETWVITVAGSLAGYYQVTVKPDHLYLLGIGLAPGFQRRGIGSGIIRRLQDRAGIAQIPLRLSVFRSQAWRLDYYLQLGFTETQRDDSFHRMVWLPQATATTPLS